jgi:Fe2+ transport system protein FeoA
MFHPLNTSREGEQVIVRCLTCHGEDACRLNELGCVEGANGRIISNQKRVILQVGESRIAITENLAKSILVSAL